jgi:hypothetical protein
MFHSSTEGHPNSDPMTRSFRSAEKFCAGWEGWLEGACSAQVKFEAEDAVRVVVLHTEWNDFLVLAEDGDFTCTGPWHCDGWVDEFSWHYYFGCLVYVDPFDTRFFGSLFLFCAYLILRSHIAFVDQVGGYCCWLDVGDWWIFCWSFLLLEVLSEQSMEGFLGWETGVVGNLFDWVVGVWSLVPNGGGSPHQVMDFASVFMWFLLICGGLGVFLLHMAERYWLSYCSPGDVLYDEGLAERLQHCFLLFMPSCFALAIICV